MSDALFRREVLQARAEQRMGRIVAVPAWPVWCGAGVIAGAAAVLVSLFVLAEHTRRIPVSGQLQPSFGVTRLQAPFAGTVARVYVREGQRVLAGQRLVYVRANGEAADGPLRDVEHAAFEQRRRAQSQSVEAQLLQLHERRQGLAAQSRDLDVEASLLEAQRRTQLRQLGLATEMLARMRRLREPKYVSELQLSQQEALVLEQEAAILVSRRQAAALHRESARLAQSTAELPAQEDALRSQSARDSALLGSERAAAEARSQALLRAPVAGIVGHLDVQPGQSLGAGQILLGLLPAVSELKAELLVPASAMAEVAPGDHVQLRYHAYPYQDHGHQGGRVERVSGSVLANGDASGRAQFRVIVSLDRQRIAVAGSLRPLKPGLSLDADILGERRRLWEWALLPMRRLSQPFSRSEPARPRTAVTSDLAPPTKANAGSAKASPVM